MIQLNKFKGIDRKYGKSFLLLILFVIAIYSGETKAQNSIFIDFGPNDNSNGKITESPDVNGNYWNNVVSNRLSTSSLYLQNTEGDTSDLKLDITSSFFSRGIKNGGLLEPNSELLGDLAIKTATQDYFFMSHYGTVTISGIDNSKRIVCSMFGTENTNEKRITEYKCQGANTWVGSLQTSGTDIGASGYNGNNNNILVSDTLHGNTNGEVVIDVTRLEGAFAYLGFMKIEIFESNSNIKYSLLNNGFENGDLSNWQVELENANSQAMVDSAVSLDGKFSLKLSGSQTNVSQQIVYHSGETYYLSADYYIPSSDSLIGEQSLSLGLVFYNENNELISKQLSDSINFESAKDKWKHLLVAATVPESTYYIEALVSWSNIENNSVGCIILDELELANYTNIIVCDNHDPLKLAVIGSSVAWGSGASNEFGYGKMYGQLLEERGVNDEGYDWEVVNASIGGNNTIDVLKRWDRDLLSQCASYAMYGLSLGNEGIHGGGQSKFEQFRDNLLLMIEMLRENNMEPIIVNNYARADFNTSDYNYVKEINMLIHEWDIASVNVLGAIENGKGKWATGYMADTWHPNTAGHKEFLYSMVPSLFDALHENKAQPIKVDGTALELTKAMNKQIVFTPEEICHPFTFSFQIKTSDYGLIASIEKGTDLYSRVEIDSISGVLKYVSSGVGTIMGTKVINDGEWHTVTLTHYYAWGKTFLYSNKIKEGELDEKLIPKSFLLGSKQEMESAFYSNLYFYRSGMTPEEIEAINDGRMLKSSLEIYAPLDEDAVFSAQPLVNLAQSTNTIVLKDAIEIPLGINSNNDRAINSVIVFPNPASEYINISYTIKNAGSVQITVYDILGNLVKQINENHADTGSYTINWDLTDSNNKNLNHGIYVCKLESDNNQYISNFIIQE